MASGIPGPPNEYPAGTDFDYSVWTPGTKVSLVNVNWDNTYKDVVRFKDKSALNSYIDSRANAGITIDKMTYAKPGEDIYVGISHNRVNRFNYLRASNPLMPSIYNDIQKDFYYFIIECEYVNAGVTRLRLQLDLWQTYVYDIDWGMCYVERGHIAIANSNRFNNYGRDYLTVPEGLNIGSDYRTIAKRTQEIIGFEGLFQKINVLVISTVDLLQDPGTKANPNQDVGPGSTLGGLPSGATFYAFETTSTFASWLATMKEFPWITQGIVSVTAVPELNRYMPAGDEFEFHATKPTRIVSYWPFPKKHKLFNSWRASSEINSVIPSRYQHVKDKFFTSPYMSIELTTWSATPVSLRPEAWNDPDAFVMERVNYIPPNQRVQITPRRYNSNGQAIEPLVNTTKEELMDLGFTSAQADAYLDMISEMGDDGGDYLDVMTLLGDFPTMPVVNNMALNYLAANTHSIAYQRQSADWAQQRALAGAQAGYDVATGQLGANMDLTNIAQMAAGKQVAAQNASITDQAGLQALGSFAGGAAGGAAFGPAGLAAGAAMGALQAGVGIAQAGVQNRANSEMYAASSEGAFASTKRGNEQGALVRDTNIDLARFAAKGDYANAIAGINAKVQDAELIQPSMSGQFGGDTLNLANGTMEVSLRWKLLDYANLRIVGEYWLRFGYAIRAFIKPPQDLMVMSKFSYWKVSEAYIVAANVPEGHKAGLRGIIGKGVTVWANPGDIGQIDLADNVPLGGISY